MTSVSCSSCSATPTPASLVADAFKKGDVGNSHHKSGSTDTNKTGTPTKVGDSVEISEAARERLRLSLQDNSSVNAPSADTHTYAKPKL